MAKTRQTPVDEEVGRRLHLLRLEKSVSQVSLAGKLGISFQQIQKYENGVNRISAGRLAQLSEIFDVPISYFFGARKSMTAEGQNVFAFVETANALRLLKAFSRIKSEGKRRALLQLVESMAGEK